MSFLALSAPPSTSQVPTLAEAFFRTHWAALSARARAGAWYPADFFVSSCDSDDDRNNPSLLLESKLPLLAAAIREVYYVYGPLCAWELQCHPYLDAQGRAFVAWSYAGDRKRVEEVFWKGIRERATEVGLKMDGVVLEGAGGAEFAKVVGGEDAESEKLSEGGTSDEE